MGGTGSAGNESTGAQRGAAKKAARLFRWTGAENVGIGGRSCGAFNAPRWTFVRREDFPKTGVGNISPATDEITVSGFPFPDRSKWRNGSGGNESIGAKRGAAKKAARLFRWTGAGNVGSEARVAARLMRRDGRSSGVGFPLLLGCPLVASTAEESTVSV
jgi:hypothetical protein